MNYQRKYISELEGGGEIKIKFGVRFAFKAQIFGVIRNSQ